MVEDSIRLNNFCVDLVSEKRTEPFVIRLLTNTQAGEWVRVDEVCAAIGLAVEGVDTELFATRLADPVGDEGYSLIVFYDNASLWTMAARYNRQRLLEEALAGDDSALNPGGQ
jgi:hypothetical protein